MRLKSPGRRTLRGALVAGMTLASVTSLVLTQAPAQADPSITYLAVGSDTPQDVMNAFSVDLAGNALGSFNAVNPTSTPASQVAGEVITATKTGNGIPGPATTAGNEITANYANPANCSFTRPNGSGGGVTALRQALGSTNTTLVTQAGEQVTISGTTGNIPNNAPQSACVDIARSSSGPGGAANANGLLVYIPFALDAVAASVGSNGNLAGLVAANGFSLPQMQALYNTGVGQVVNNVCYQPTGGTVCSGSFTSTKTVDLYVPQPNSGTRNFWLQTMDGGTVPNPLPAWVFDHIQAGPNATQPVEEHDGTAVSTDPNGLGPFSISQWISQSKTGFGHNDRRASAVLLPMAATTGGTVQQPITAGGVLNTSFPVTRNVFNVVEFDRVSDTHPASGPDPFDVNLAGMLVGVNSALCQDAAEIVAYGFATIGATCGSLTNRAYPAGATNVATNF